MRGVTTEVNQDNDTAVVEVTDREARAGLIEKLLDAAGDDPRQIKVLTGGRNQQYRVPLALAKKAGLIHRPAAKKAAPAKAAPKQADKEDSAGSEADGKDADSK